MTGGEGWRNVRGMTDPAVRQAITDLLLNWFKGRLYIIDDVSANYAADYQVLVDEARTRAAAIGITWDDDWTPSYVTETIAAAHEN